MAKRVWGASGEGGPSRQDEQKKDTELEEGKVSHSHQSLRRIDGNSSAQTDIFHSFLIFFFFKSLATFTTSGRRRLEKFDWDSFR